MVSEIMVSNFTQSMIQLEIRTYVVIGGHWPQFESFVLA